MDNTTPTVSLKEVTARLGYTSKTSGTSIHKAAKSLGITSYPMHRAAARGIQWVTGFTAEDAEKIVAHVNAQRAAFKATRDARAKAILQPSGQNGISRRRENMDAMRA